METLGQKFIPAQKENMKKALCLFLAKIFASLKMIMWNLKNKMHGGWTIMQFS